MLEKKTSWGHQARAERALAEERGIEQRRSAAAAQAALVGGEGSQRQRRRAEAQPRPRRPAVLAPLDERQDDVDESEGDERGPHEVQAVGALDARLGHRARDHHQGDEADRHVDEKAAAPAQAGDVGLHEDAADELAADRGEAEREHPPAAELVAQAPGGDQEGGEGQAVAGDHPFDRARSRVQITLHRGHGDVDDEEVQHDHERAREDDGQGGPLVRQRAGGPRQAGCEFVCAHDAHHRASAPAARRLPAR
jgi:hypothetical protein